MRKLIAGTSWKMNKTAAETRDYVTALLSLLKDVDFNRVTVFVLPPFTSLGAAASLLENSPVAFGAQNMHWDAAGAWTGEVSAPMLVEAGCRYVELGHSERRYYFNETDDSVNRKVLAALRHRLIPIICIGETREEKAAGSTEAVLKQQVVTALRGVEPDAVPGVIVAYEPRWAIGQSEAASPNYIQAMHRYIRACLSDCYGEGIAGQTPVVYGGSVNPDNTVSIMAQVDVDGIFVGRAALDPRQFARMVKMVEDEGVRRNA